MILQLSLLCLAPLALSAQPPVITWNFDAVSNVHAFQSAACEITVQHTPSARRGIAGRGIRIAYQSGNSGPCGVWMRLFDDANPSYPDIRRYPFFSFWVTGETGVEDAEVRIASPEGLAKEDSNPAGMITHYLKNPVNSDWREVVVPFKDFDLASSQAAVFVLSFPPGSAGVLHLDDVSLQRAASSRVPSTGTRAMWLWETAEAIASEQQQSITIANLLHAGVGLLFLQLPKSSFPELRSFLGKAHASGIAVSALDGEPELALAEMLPAVDSLIQRILDFNRESPDPEKFDGIHFDIEPYQLLGFDSPMKPSILREFIGMQKQIRARLELEELPMAYGIDLPFWLERGLMHQLLQYTDSVAVMAYRNKAIGDDSILSLAKAAIEEAGISGKLAYVGVETEPSVDATIAFACSVAEKAWQIEANLAWPLLRRSNIDGFSLRSRVAGNHRLIGLAENPRRDPAAFQQALQLLSVACQQWPGSPGEMAILSPRNYYMEKGLPKITFAGLSLAKFETALSLVGDTLVTKSGFGGIAVHSYSSFLKIN